MATRHLKIAVPATARRRVVSTRDCDGHARLRHIEAVMLRHTSQRLLNVLWLVSNLQTQALLNQLIPCSDNTTIAEEDKRDLRLLDCLAQSPLQPVRHIRSMFKMATDVWRPLALSGSFHEFASFLFSHVTLQEGSPDTADEETHAIRLTRAWRDPDKNCPLGHFLAPGVALVLQPFGLQVLCM